jgi:hypothetical protein
MTNASVDNDLRPKLEGTLTDFPIVELLGLLSSTRQTGTLQVAVRPGALVTIVDGQVAFASTDPAFTVRDLLVGGGVISSALWQLTVSTGVAVSELGEALVSAGADREALQRAISEQVIGVCEAMVDEAGARFRFMRQPRSSMGDAFICPTEQLRRRLLDRTEEWARLRAVVTSPAAQITVPEELADGYEAVLIGRADWPVLLRVGAGCTAAELDAQSGLGAFATTRAIVRLWEAGAVRVDGQAFCADTVVSAGVPGPAESDVAEIAAAQPTGDDPFGAVLTPPVTLSAQVSPPSSPTAAVAAAVEPVEAIAGP